MHNGFLFHSFFSEPASSTEKEKTHRHPSSITTTNHFCETQEKRRAKQSREAATNCRLHFQTGSSSDSLLSEQLGKYLADFPKLDFCYLKRPWCLLLRPAFLDLHPPLLSLSLFPRDPHYERSNVELRGGHNSAQIWPRNLTCLLNPDLWRQPNFR